jgi:hypothetical protein
MSAELFKEIVEQYQRHGWELRRVLLKPATRSSLETLPNELFKQASLVDFDFDAFWFARSSQGAREAWELRLATEHPYALFEAFEADETEEDREEARLEMQNKMREQLAGK